MQKQTKTYVEYTNRRVNQIKKALRAGTPRLEIAKTLAKEWGVRINPVYQKTHKVAAELKATKLNKKMQKANNSINLVKKTNGIVLSGETLKVYNKLKKEPTKIVLHDDHVRYYF